MYRKWKPKKTFPPRRKELNLTRYRFIDSIDDDDND